MGSLGGTKFLHHNIMDSINLFEKPEERPFLMIVQPIQDQNTGEIKANTSFLCPSFEAERARLLGMPFSEPIQVIPWEEHWNPYSTLMESQAISGQNGSPRLMVDEEMRDFIQRGLSSAGFDIVGLKGRVEQVRQTKSESEVGILRAVNTGTVEAVRQMRKCEFVLKITVLREVKSNITSGLYPGLTESEITEVLDNTLRAAGLEPFFDIVLFGTSDINLTLTTKLISTRRKRCKSPRRNKWIQSPRSRNLYSDRCRVRLPLTTSRPNTVLTADRAHLYGYSSDICRTFFPPFFKKPACGASTPEHIKEKLKVQPLLFNSEFLLTTQVWETVFEAQTQSIHQMRENSTAASIDIAARDVISEAGYGETFTHRVGHGIGIKG